MGGACSQPTLVKAALEALGTGRARLVVLGEHDHRPDVVNVPMACSSEGAMEVYMEPVLPPPKVHIVGSSPDDRDARRSRPGAWVGGAASTEETSTERRSTPRPT